jgi:hypothetical protein
VVGLRALRVADEHPQSASVVELTDVVKLIGEREAAEASYGVLPLRALMGERLRI